jgi:hypothetical protein
MTLGRKWLEMPEVQSEFDRRRRIAADERWLRRRSEEYINSIEQYERELEAPDRFWWEDSRRQERIKWEIQRLLDDMNPRVDIARYGE